MSRSNSSINRKKSEKAVPASKVVYAPIVTNGKSSPIDPIAGAPETIQEPAVHVTEISLLESNKTFVPQGYIEVIFIIKKS